MKKIGIVAAIIMLIIIIGLSLVHINEKDTDVTKEQTMVGVILNGKCEDMSWGQSHYEGIEKSAKELNLNIIYRECVPEDSRCIKYMEDLIAEGCRIIICDSYGYGDWELKVAEMYPEIHFFHATGVETRKNLSTYFGRIYQMRYLSGIVAGLQTESNEIGYVAAYPISEVNRGINAFTLGVRAVNPEAVVYVEWSNTWHDYDQTKEATDRLFDNKNIDVVTMHTDSMAVLDEAEERGIYSIGYNHDNSKLYPKTFLTAPVWNWEKYYSEKILECIQEKIIGDSFWGGIESGIVDLAPLTENVKPGIKEVVENQYERLKNGEFDVFYGRICDNEGNERVKEGENISDYSLLNEFDWYVEGVVISEE